jgi:hypothetical protein
MRICYAAKDGLACPVQIPSGFYGAGAHLKLGTPSGISPSIASRHKPLAGRRRMPWTLKRLLHRASRSSQ